MPGPLDCPFCGYDCSAVPSGVCPECGRPVFRYTERAREVIAIANQHAIRLMTRPTSLFQSLRTWFIRGTGLQGIACSHILMRILTGPRGVGYYALQQLVGDCGALLTELKRLDTSVAFLTVPESTRLPLHPSARRVTLQAVEQAARLGHDWVGTEHLLLAICEDASPGTRDCLMRSGVTRDNALVCILNGLRQCRKPPSVSET